MKQIDFKVSTLTIGTEIYHYSTIQPVNPSAITLASYLDVG